jgi:hypothetical protein
MGKYDHLTKLEIQAELRRIETVPQAFWHEGIYEMRDRLAELEEIEKTNAQENEVSRWSADMFQKIQAHDDAMALAKAQLDHQRSSTNKAMWVSIVAALAAIASAIASFLARP